ncbi:hypothetical protein [Acidocella sp.]|uniref:head-tail joining protein n=1 Tax=Acidocella sp. TaxID=50710 RepID=UPI002608B082|nr:hypothetical protein [Acidocella sp.]
MTVDWDGLVIGPLAATFGQSVTYTHQAGTVEAITGVFDSEYLSLDPIGGSLEQLGSPANITSSRPVLGVQLSQFLAAPLQGDTLTLATGAAYSVMEVRPDGHGWAKLLLNAK